MLLLDGIITRIDHLIYTTNLDVHVLLILFASCLYHVFSLETEAIEGPRPGLHKSMSR